MFYSFLYKKGAFESPFFMHILFNNYMIEHTKNNHIVKAIMIHLYLTMNKTISII